MARFAIKADGGKSVGMGHIMRCLSLAKTIQQNGHSVYFFSSLDEGIHKLCREGFEVIRVNPIRDNQDGFCYGNPAGLPKEASVMRELLDQYQIDVFIIDSYNVSREYFLALRSHVARLIYIDDINAFSYPVDIVVNGNITGEFLGYQKFNEQQMLLLGPRFNMIRDEFSHLPPRTIRDLVAEVMITTGGSDPYNLTCKILNMVLAKEDFRHLRWNVLVGTGFTNCENLVQIRQCHENVFLYANSVWTHKYPDIHYSEVSSIMLRSDLAISAGGSSLYEFAACGTPVLAFILADNQEFIVRKMDDQGYVKSLGWYNQLDEEKIVCSLANMMSDYSQRKEMSRKGQRLVDGKGTERILQSIIGSLGIN